MNKFLLTIIVLLVTTYASLAQSKQEMKVTKSPNYYTTSPAQKKELQTSFKHNNTPSKVYISKKEFKKFPKKKQEAILNESEKYIITEE